MQAKLKFKDGSTDRERAASPNLFSNQQSLKAQLRESSSEASSQRTHSHSSRGVDGHTAPGSKSVTPQFSGATPLSSLLGKPKESR